MIHPTRPIDRAPPHLRQAHDAAAKAFAAAPSEANWLALLATIRAALDAVDAARKAGAA